MPTFAQRRLHVHPHLPITRRSPSSPNIVSPREPALISLPIPVPSVPVLNPILTPLIAGKNQPVQTSVPQNPAPVTIPPAETTTAIGSQPTSGSGDGNGNGNGNGTGNSNGNGNGNGNENGNGEENNGNGGSTGSGVSSGGDPAPGASGQPTDGSSPTSGGSSAGAGSIPLPSGSIGTSNTAPSSNPTSGSSFLSDPEKVPVNAGNDPSEEGSTTRPVSDSIWHSGTVSSGSTNGISVGIPSVSGAPRNTEGSGDGSVGGGGDGGNVEGTGAANQGEQHGRLSSGAIAGIVITILLVIVAVSIMLLRRRWLSRRSERREQWWFSRNHTPQTYADRAHGDIGIGGGVGGNVKKRKSVRSSFETTVDHSQTPRLDLDFDIPALPPMAELRREPVLVNVDSPISPKITVSKPNSTTTPESRYSVGTVSSVESDGHGQWLIVNRNSLLVPEIGTPMSVRPFSPTESFAFPKPPTDKSSGDWSSQFSRPASSYTLNASAVGGAASSLRGAGPDIAEEVPGLPVPSPVANPFSDPDPIALHAAAVAALGIPTGATATATETKDPFADPLPPEPSTPSAVHPEFMEVEMIKRPFIPTLGDELPVDVGDRVRILHMFDDGWALVEKNPVYYAGSPVKGKWKEPEKGLIPIDCFRDLGVDVSSFIATKRVSSYSQTSGYTAGGVAM